MLADLPVSPPRRAPARPRLRPRGRGRRLPVGDLAEPLLLLVRAAGQMAGTGVKAVNVLASPLLHIAREAIMERLNGARLPTIYQWPDTAEEGGLLGYGPRLPACIRQVAALVKR